MINKKNILLFIILLLLSSLAIYLFFNKSNNPAIIIAPHHNLVHEKRLSFFKDISSKNQNIKTIILLSPDHFSHNQYSVSFADNLSYDFSIGPKITNGLAKENGIITGDHGIMNLLPDIKMIWPNAKLIPILIGQQVKFAKLQNLITNINSNCHIGCLVIASVDFSHYLPAALADVHDQKSLQVLTNLNEFQEKDLEVDSPQSLFIATQIAKINKLTNWNLFGHTNSGRIENSRDAETTSHIFGWYDNSGNSSNTINKSTTFLIATNLDEVKDKKSLGERFFYGVDYQNLKLSSPFKPCDKIIIEPTQGVSSVEYISGNIKITLGSDLVISGYVTHEKIILVLIPIANNEGVNTLLRGDEKTKHLENLQVDTSNGTVVLLK